jgi:hypothetical protein
MVRPSTRDINYNSLNLAIADKEFRRYQRSARKWWIAFYQLDAIQRMNPTYDMETIRSSHAEHRHWLSSQLEERKATLYKYRKNSPYVINKEWRRTNYKK